MHKEVKDVLKGLREYADPPSSFTMVQNNHLKLSWEMKNDNGEKVLVRSCLSVTPSDTNWMYSHKRSLRIEFNRLNITTDIDHI